MACRAGLALGVIMQKACGLPLLLLIHYSPIHLVVALERGSSRIAHPQCPSSCLQSVIRFIETAIGVGHAEDLEYSSELGTQN